MNDRAAGASLLLLVTLAVLPARAADDPPAYRTQWLQGHVVYLGEALEEALGIETVPEAKRRELAVRTDQGEIIPLVENLRARAFRKDDRLMQMHVGLLVRRYDRTPVVQIVRVYEVAPDGRILQVDYWCDVCAIVMFEKGPCACCQDPNRLRKRPVPASELPAVVPGAAR